MQNWVFAISTAMHLFTWVIILVGGFFLRKYLPAYFQEKGKNLATKEDIKEITEKVEAVRAHYARQLELYKYEVSLMEKRRELSAQVVDLINRYKELPPAGEKQDEEQLRRFEQDYYKLVPWIPTDILKALNSLFAKSVLADAKALSIFNFVFFVYNPPAITTPEGSKRCPKRQFTNVSVLRASSLENIQTRSYTIK
jgi:hypothetical protein